MEGLGTGSLIELASVKYVSCAAPRIGWLFVELQALDRRLTPPCSRLQHGAYSAVLPPEGARRVWTGRLGGLDISLFLPVRGERGDKA